MHGGGVALVGEIGCELAGALFIGAMGEADEEVVFGFADVAAIERAGRFDLGHR